MPVAVVTDSTAYLPSELAGTCTVVPLTVVVGDRQGREGIDIAATDVAEALQVRRQIVTTSRPAPAEFIEVYDLLLGQGNSGVVSVHLSAKLSGTIAAATAAAEQFGDRVQVVDSGSVGMGLGFPVMAGLETAGSGGDSMAVRRAVEAATERTTTLFCVDTLEYLRRGGRIGAAASLVGTALAVKPILRVTSAGIVVTDRVRTATRAVARLSQLALAATGTGDVRIAVHHLGEADRANALSEELAARLGPRLRHLYLVEVGATVGAHAGPGLLGLVIHRLGGA
ncbi:MAG: DegV family protein [Micromonosporaceae bacterium]|nr:DegV family protein [Micromonosporaceae bacterium]